MWVNDIGVEGAEALFFLDYLASGRLCKGAASTVVQSTPKGCAQSGCALIGGETAEMPGLYASGDFDIAGFAVGAAERGTLLPRPGLKPGDLVFGLPSSGVHSNGFSLVRRIVTRSGLGWEAPAPFDPSRSLAVALLTPTRLYVLPMLDALKRTRGIHALAHITGGGYPDNLPRVLESGLAVSLDLDAFTPQPVFSWLASVGSLDEGEMLRTCNCGFGMASFVPADSETEARDALAAAGLSPVLIGELVPAEGRALSTRGKLRL